MSSNVLCRRHDQVVDKGHRIKVFRSKEVRKANVKPVIHSLYDVWVDGVYQVSLVQDHVLPPDIGGKGVAGGAVQPGGTLVVASRLPRWRGGDQRWGAKEVGDGETDACDKEQQEHAAL